MTDFRKARITAIFEAMNNFPVLAGRATERQAEFILDALDKIADTSITELEIGKSYITKTNEVVKIVSRVRHDDPNFERGCRVISSECIYYHLDGSQSMYGPTPQDIVTEVINHTDRRLGINETSIVESLGYMSAMGQTIRAIKLHRSIFNTGLVEAKRIVEAAAEDARKKYLITVSASEVSRLSRENDELRACLRETRRLVAACADDGFTGPQVDDLYRNNGAISRLVPITREERNSINFTPIKD